MCTLRWEIWEKEGVQKRSDISREYEDIFIENIMRQSVDGYTIEEIERTRYRDKNIILPEEAFAFKRKLIPSKANAFLLRDNK